MKSNQGKLEKIKNKINSAAKKAVVMCRYQTKPKTDKMMHYKI